MIGLFVSAGEQGSGLPSWGGTDNRSVEYDSLGDHMVYHDQAHRAARIGRQEGRGVLSAHPVELGAYVQRVSI